MNQTTMSASANQMTAEDIQRIEDFVRWANKHGYLRGLTLYKSPLDMMAQSEAYEVETIQRFGPDDTFRVATPKDEQLKRLSYYE